MLNHADGSFAYDGDGVRTLTLYTPYVDGEPQTAVLTAYYMGGAYEAHSDGIMRKYYAIAGQSIAMRAYDPLRLRHLPQIREVRIGVYIGIGVIIEVWN